jgi:hypothetical protein
MTAPRFFGPGAAAPPVPPRAGEEEVVEVAVHSLGLDEMTGTRSRGREWRPPVYRSEGSAVVVDDVRVGGERKRSEESQSSGGAEGVG